jgi:hypothetical protein
MTFHEPSLQHHLRKANLCRISGRHHFIHPTLGEFSPLPLNGQCFRMCEGCVTNLGLQMLNVRLRFMQSAFCAFTGGTFAAERILRQGKAVCRNGLRATDITRPVEHDDRNLTVAHKAARPAVLVMSLHLASPAPRVGRRFCMGAVIGEPEGTTH